MGARTHHQGKYVIKEYFEHKDVKLIIAMLTVELGLLLLVANKGLVAYYFPVALLLMFFTVIGSYIVFKIEADRYLLIIVLVLMNLGFVVQQIQSGKNMQVIVFLAKFSVAIGSSVIVAILYNRFASLLSKDIFLWLMIAIQYAICLVIFLVGIAIGNFSEQGAIISIRGITPFELVKFMYIFIAAGLLCRDKKKIRFFNFFVPSEPLLIIHTIVLSLIFIACRELGTLMIVYITGMIMLWIYGERRKIISFLIIFSVFGFGLIWFISDSILYPKIFSGELLVPGLASKLIKRFGTALHPEMSMIGSGYQGTLGLEAIAIGGALGLISERYRLPLPEASNDFVFANVVQTCGLLMGFLVVLFIFAFLKRGTDIANKCEDTYFQGVAICITDVIIVEAVIHIGYNLAMLPITGIPLYFVSQGFTAVVTGMAFITVLLVISTGTVYREED